METPTLSVDTTVKAAWVSLASSRQVAHENTAPAIELDIVTALG
jgi:hypothetical protein